jgi:hypothetical protein
MTETAPTNPRKKYLPPDGKQPYRVVVKADDGALRFLDPGFENADAALKWAKENVTGDDVVIHVVRMVLHRKSVAVPAKTRWV